MMNKKIETEKESPTYAVNIDGHIYKVKGEDRSTIVTNALILYRWDVPGDTRPSTYLRMIASVLLDQKFDKRFGENRL